MVKLENRIRVGVLIFEDNKILLVKHVDPVTGFSWWVPPGGGLKGTESIFECGEREVKEETNLKVKLDKIAYIRQFTSYKEKQNNIEIYVTSSNHKGRMSIKGIIGKGEDESYIKQVKFFSKKELKNIKVFPSEIKEEMWEDHKKGFPAIKFLGVEDDSEHGVME
ncbi:MAG: NUDIX hydrolase [Nanoarchaeota archaeon]|nr:NUDIX hydrolase [Nanoarchaeota archaeon]